MSEDLISRQAAIVAVLYAKDDLDAERLIKGLPSAQRKGKWIPGKELSREFIGITELHIEYEKFTCSSCGLTVKDLLYHADGSPFYKFCPNCGAEMIGEEDETDRYR